MAERLLAEELDHGLLGDLCEVIVIVDHGMHHMGILEHSLHAQAFRRVLYDLPHGLLVLIQEVGTSDALHGDMIGDRVVAIAAGDGSDGEHHGVQGVAHAGDILLEVIDDRRSAGDGICAQVGRGRMGGGTNHIHREAARVGHAGTGGNVDIGNIQRAPDMLAEDGVHTVQRTLCDHSLRADDVLLRRLEDEPHIALQLLPVLLKELGGAQQHGNVGIVAAGVHFPRLAGGEGQSRLLLEGQRVRVCPQAHGLAGLAAVDGGDQAVAVDHIPDIGDAQCLQIPVDGVPGVLLLPGQLRMLMVVVPTLHHIRGSVLCQCLDVHCPLLPQLNYCCAVSAR